MINAQLQTAVQDELKWNPTVDDRHIAVTTDEGAVTLTGYVPSYFEKTRAVAAVERVYGAMAVADELEVRLHEAHTREDSDIAKSIAYVLECNSMLSSHYVKASVSNGHVKLTGDVDWNYQRQEAANAVYRLLGVRSVSNQIMVKPRVTSAQVEEQITTALARSSALDAKQIHVTTSGATAILSGHVHSLDESRTARNAAWLAEGIDDVEDRLVIQPH
jgi:osmotically-inducible protein OsmY